MSNKTAKIKQVKRGLVPKLRFPEFSDSEWKNEPLKDLYSFKSTNSYPRDMLNYQKGSVKNIHYGDIHTKFSTLFDIKSEEVPFVNPLVSLSKIKQESYCVEGDIIFADASEDLNDIGKSIEIINVRGEKLISGLHTLLARQKAKKFVVGFSGYLFASNSARYQIKKEAQGAKVLGISATRLSNIRIGFPLDKKEQQKIVDCLSSVDDLIMAQGRRVKALKKYKKGLMQQFFPREGEATPRLRFPEFHNAGEWGQETIKSICTNIFSGGTPLTTERNYYGGNIPFIRSAEINREKTELFLTNEGLSSSSAKIIKKGDVLVALYGANSGDVSLARLNGAINQAILCLQSKNSNDFIYQYLSHKKDWVVSTYIQGGQGNLSGEIVKSIKIAIPKKPSEQQKIANCLSYVDDLIISQEQKIDALKEYKKGLMQQLFPTLEDLRNE
jgi:type I restriction enzyme S subunit